MPTSPPRLRPSRSGKARGREQDKRRRAHQPWRAWYKTARWARRRASQLTTEPLCRFCKDEGRTTAAEVADHVIPHRGDERLFFEGELQSLCKRCHDSTKARIERGGSMPGCDEDGLPLDPSHPWRRDK